MFEQMEFDRNPHVGIYGKANDSNVFLRKNLPKKIRNKIAKVLNARVVEINIAESSIVGSLLAVNSYGAVVTNYADEEAVEAIKETGLDVFVIQDKYNAAGNNILVNDYGALVHPDIRRYNIKQMEKVFGVPVKTGTIAGLKTVGMAAVVTNKGLLCHPKVEEKEREELERLFKVEVMVGTVNHGVPLVGSGIIANSHGAVVGKLTTGIEMGRIEEALGFL
ncbi:MAG: translation initiation factor IF-6 [Thermoplasmata archaeon]|nr:MAG: translation initiation factor IF-6 [Thermoplasmata archaeon]RLF39376.1 MAG: translation initiation factor IF-6 [Thermoplasmata archaeon]